MTYRKADDKEMEYLSDGTRAETQRLAIADFYKNHKRQQINGIEFFVSKDNLEMFNDMIKRFGQRSVLAWQCADKVINAKTREILKDRFSGQVGDKEPEL